ncbi:MAG: TadE/TadG family type IV pilus assembly protein [Acidimicrobiales bacterium]
MRCSAASDPHAHDGGARREPDAGQAAVELALCLPVVFVLLLGVVQVAVVVRDELLVQHAAREAARAASVSASPGGAATAAASRALVPAGLAGTSVGASVGGTTVRVVVRAVTRTDVPLIGALIGDVAHTASAEMVLEPP